MSTTTTNWKPVVSDLIKRLQAAGFDPVRINDGGDDDEEIDSARSDELKRALLTDGICSVDVSQFWVAKGNREFWIYIVLDTLPFDIVNDYTSFPALDLVIESHSDFWAGKETPTTTPEPAGITLPIIHMNGSGKKTLQETYDAAADSLQNFIKSWGNTEFNSRDYYVSRDPEAWNKAVAEREAMNAKIRDVRDYLQTIREHLHA